MIRFDFLKDRTSSPYGLSIDVDDYLNTGLYTPRFAFSSSISILTSNSHFPTREDFFRRAREIILGHSTEQLIDDPILHRIINEKAVDIFIEELEKIALNNGVGYLRVRKIVSRILRDHGDAILRYLGISTEHCPEMKEIFFGCYDHFKLIGGCYYELHSPLEYNEIKVADSISAIFNSTSLSQPTEYLENECAFLKAPPNAEFRNDLKKLLQSLNILIQRTTVVEKKPLYFTIDEEGSLEEQRITSFMYFRSKLKASV